MYRKIEGGNADVKLPNGYVVNLDDGWAIVRNDKHATGGEDELTAVVATELQADLLLQLLNPKPFVTGDIKTAELNIEVSMRDMGNEEAPHGKAKIHANNEMISLGFNGYGEKNGIDGQGTPVVVEMYKGHPRVLIWSDINQEDPTHIVSLEHAAEKLRKE